MHSADRATRLFLAQISRAQPHGRRGEAAARPGARAAQAKMQTSSPARPPVGRHLSSVTHPCRLILGWASFQAVSFRASAPRAVLPISFALEFSTSIRLSIGFHFWSLEEPRGSENRETVKGRDGETSSDSDGWRRVPDPRRVPDNQSLARHVRRRARDAKTQETPAIKVPGSEGALLGGLVCRVMSSSLASRQVPKQLHPPAESGLAARAGEDGCQNMAEIACCFSVSLGLSSAQCHAPHAAGSWSKRSQCRAELNDIADLTGPPCPSVFRVPRCGLVTATVLKAGTEHASSVDWPLQR